MRKPLLVILSFVAASIVHLSGTIEEGNILADQVLATPVPLEQSAFEYIAIYSEQFNVDKDLLKKVMMCESSGNKNAIGDGGRAVGVMQFHKPTFDSFTKKYQLEMAQVGIKIPDLDYYSTRDQIKLSSWAFSKGYANHWTCYTKIAARLR